MKKQFRTLAALFFCGLTLAACSDKEDNEKENVEINATKTYTMTITASKGENSGLSKALALESGSLNATWKQGEVVAVYKSENKIGELTAQSDGASTTLSGEFTGENIPSAEDALTLKFNETDYSNQDGTLAYIAAHCDYAVANVNVKEVIDGKITIKENYADFENQQAIVKFTLKNSSGTELNATVLKIKAGETTYEFTGSGEYYLALNGFSSTMILLATVGENKYQYYKEDATFQNGAFVNVNVKMQDVKSIADATVAINNVINSDGNVYINRTVADFAGTARAAVVYVGSKDGYCTKCLAVGLEDISTSVLPSKTYNGKEGARNKMTEWGNNNAIKVSELTYGYIYPNDPNSYYEWTESGDVQMLSHTTSLIKGWRLLLATDMFLIMGENFQSLKHGNTYGNFSTLKNTINTACGNSSFSGTDYGTGTENKVSDKAGTWHYNSANTFYWANDGDNYAYRYRAVFAW